MGNPIFSISTRKSIVLIVDIRVSSEETGLYYLESRYYDPEVGRYLNADSVIGGVGGPVQGYNMFAYCFNNPVNMFDDSGHWPKWIKDVVNWVNNNPSVHIRTGYHIGTFSLGVYWDIITNGSHTVLFVFFIVAKNF